MNNQKIKSVGIIGMGEFGKLVLSLVPKNITVKTHRHKDVIENLKDVVNCDILFLCIPLKAYDEVLRGIKNIILPETLLVDVCSVKIKPAKIIGDILPDHKNILLTHPLFGPQSLNNGKKHTLIITSEMNYKSKALIKYCEGKLNLDIQHMSNEDHDKRMAEIHALTFFVARGLAKLNLTSEPFMTPSFHSLLDLVELDNSHSESLFQTIQNGNPYAKVERQNYINKLKVVDSSLD